MLSKFSISSQRAYFLWLWDIYNVLILWKVIAGDDDIPKRDDVGERRRKYELRVLAGAGIKSGDDVEDDETGNLSSDGAADANEESGSDSDLDFYKQVEQKHVARLAEKSAKYSRYHRLEYYIFVCQLLYSFFVSMFLGTWKTSIWLLLLE